LIIEEGMRAVREFRKYFPEKEILADTKIVDAGAYEAELAFKAGADYCTVIAITDHLTIKECIKSAEHYRKKVFVDTINTQNITESVPQLEELGVDHISVHVGVDEQAVGKTPLSALKEVKQISKQSIVSVAGGINVDTIEQYIALKADVVIVGGGINHADDPVATAQILAKKIHKKNFLNRGSI